MLHAGIETFLRNFSIEALPRQVDGRSDFARLPAGTKIYLTRLAKAPFSDMVGAARRVRDLGLTPVPHLTARTIRSERDLRDEIEALVREAAVDEVLLVAGSQSRRAVAFESTIDVLRTGAFEASGILRIGLAGHPEGHPDVDEARLQSALDQKNDFARASALEYYLITQFFFDATPVIAWERRIRELGNTLPVVLGIHGLTGSAALLKHAIACGIGASLEVLADHRELVSLAVVRSPERLIAAIVSAIERDPQCLFTGAHLFPLGGFAKTARWATALANGRFTIAADGSLSIG